MTDTDSTCVGHEPCPKCGSSDNLARYDDGHAYCFSMGCDHYEPPTDFTSVPDTPAMAATVKRKKPVDLINDWEPQTLTKRGLNLKTCEKWKYGTAKFNGKNVQVANYVRDGQIVAQKVRFANKDFLMLGDGKNCGLYGQHLWRDGGKKLCITEGEIDALSVSQLFNLKWPVVSVPKGAQGAAKAIKAELEWVMKFDEVIFMFDNDEAGRAATEECVGLLPPGRAKIASFEMKDANAMMVAGRGHEVVDAFWSAREYRPDGIISVEDVRDEALKPIELGVPWPWPTLTEATYGRRDCEVYALGAGTGVGKTDWFTQLVTHDAVELDIKCGVIYLEQPPVETVRRIAGKLSGHKYHLPSDGTWDATDLAESIDTLVNTDNIVLYNHFGSMDWETVEAKIRYMVTGLGVKHIFLDHLTALASHADDERKELEALMADIASLAQELRIKFHFISHLATPDGKPHEEGGRVTIRHFKGSRAIGYWSHFMFGLERDQQSKDEEARHISTFRVLKDRVSGQSTGLMLGLKYDHSTGLLNEAPLPEEKPSNKGTIPPGTQEDF